MTGNPLHPIKAQPVEELILELTDPIIEEKDGIRRATATAVLTYNPADNSRAIESKRYHFTAPLGAVKSGEIRWYIEKYYQWPTGVSENSNRERTREISPDGAMRYIRLPWAGKSAP